MFADIVRGGQTLIHRVRMFSQVVGTSLTIATFVGLLITSVTVYNKVPSHVWRQMYYLGQAKLYTSTLHFAGTNVNTITQDFGQRNGRIVTVYSMDVIRDKEINYNYQYTIQTIKGGLWAWLFLSILFFVLGLLVWGLRGRAINKDRHLRGAILGSSRDLKRAIKKGFGRVRALGTLKWTKNKIPFLRAWEVWSTLIVGSPGSGKTVAMLELMNQVRKPITFLDNLMGRFYKKVIVYDMKGTFVSKFYREGKDIILNPLDTRFPNWDLWSECDSPQDFNNIAATLMPLPKSTGDTFWIKASRTIFAAACRKLKERGCRDTRELLQQIFSDTEDEDELAKLLKGTEAEVLVSKDIKQTALSIKATLTTHCACLMYLPPFDKNKRSFSIREWMKTKDDSWLFISVVNDNSYEAIRPLISIWADIAFQSVLARKKKSKSRVYSFIDELPSLNRLVSIEKLLALGREYGSAFFTAAQDVNQFKVTYGEQAESLLPLFNTTLFFRSNGAKSCEWLAGTLGKREYEESKESRSYGANTMRDGVNISHNKRYEHIVLPDEISNLNELEGYLKVPGDYPVAKVSFKYKEYKNISPEIIPREIKLKDFDLSAILNTSVNTERKAPLNKEDDELVITEKMEDEKGKAQELVITDENTSIVMDNEASVDEELPETEIDDAQIEGESVRKPRSDKGKRRKANKTVVGYVASPRFKKNDTKKTKILTVNLAENASCASKNNVISQTTIWYKLVFFDGLAEEALKVVTKGCRLEALGKHKEVVDVDKETGEETSKHEIIVETFKLLSSPKQQAIPPNKQSQAAKDFEKFKDLKLGEYSYEEVVLGANELERGR